MTETNLPATAAPQRTAVTVGGNVGALIPQDIEQAFRIAQALAHSGMTPNGFKTPETCFVAIMAGAELGLPPFQSLQSFAIINNRPTLWGDALVAVVRTNGFTLREWYEGEGDTLTAFCEVTRPDNGDTAEASFSVDDAKTAGLWKKSGPWTSNPKRMLKMRARAFAIRDGAADVLRGFQIREEVEDYDTAALPVEEKRAGTGLLAKLESSQTLATEGFGVRNLDEEVAEPAPKKRAPRKAKAADLGSEVLDAIAEAEPEIVAQVVEDHAAAPEPSADGQVEEPATEPATTAETVADGHAEPGEGYFLGDKEAFPSGRRVWYIDGVEQKDTADDGTLPVYAEHAPKVDAGNHQTQTTDSETTENTVSDAEKPASAEPELGFDAPQSDPFQTFSAAFAVSHSWADLRPHLVELGKSDAWRARPHDANKVRLQVAEMIKVWNDAGAKLDPAEDAWLFQCYVAGCDDVEAIQGTLALVQSAEWFSKATETQQSSIGRFALNRIQQIGGA